MSGSDRVPVRVLRLPNAEGLEPPAYQSDEAAGLDLVCALDADGSVDIQPGDRFLAPTGFAMELPIGYEGQVRPRSGLAVKHGVTVLNTPGTIDSDYRGEIRVILYNAGEEAFRLERGMRIAQLVIAPVSRAELRIVDDLSTTRRATGGFGSTGSKIP